eukprot:5029379-Lingulodinium_polyedra.AAC.1
MGSKTSSAWIATPGARTPAVAKSRSYWELHARARSDGSRALAWTPANLRTINSTPAGANRR